MRHSRQDLVAPAFSSVGVLWNHILQSGFVVFASMINVVWSAGHFKTKIY